MYVANCSLKYNPESFTVVDKVLTLANKTELVGDPFIAHHCGGLLLDDGVFEEKKVNGKYVLTLVGATPTTYMKAKCSLLCDSDKFELVDGALSLKAVEPSGFDITWDGDTTGLDVVNEVLFKVSSDVSSIGTAANLVGATLVLEGTTIPPIVLTEDDIYTEDDKIYTLTPDEVVLVAFDDGTYVDENYTKGIWFSKVGEGMYVARLYKE